MYCKSEFKCSEWRQLSGQFQHRVYLPVLTSGGQCRLLLERLPIPGGCHGCKRSAGLSNMHQRSPVQTHQWQKSHINYSGHFKSHWVPERLGAHPMQQVLCSHLNVSDGATTVNMGSMATTGVPASVLTNEKFTHWRNCQARIRKGELCANVICPLSGVQSCLWGSPLRPTFWQTILTGVRPLLKCVSSQWMMNTLGSSQVSNRGAQKDLVRHCSLERSSQTLAMLAEGRHKFWTGPEFYTFTSV